ncbi:MAG: hypothetical protein K6G91_00035 [Kiritimatiellae bacterium]|nr:hypothetical protein [Kiritimatiellia bacterium]
MAESGEYRGMERGGIVRVLEQLRVLGAALGLGDLARAVGRVCVPELGEKAVVVSGVTLARTCACA